MLARAIVAPLMILLSVVLASACDHRNPSRSMMAPSPGQMTPAPAPPAQPDVWNNVTARLTAVSEGECVGETMRSQIGVSRNYSVSIMRNGTSADLVLRSASGDHVCTFTGGRADGDSLDFTRGYFWCDPGSMVHAFSCSNGLTRDLWPLSGALSGRISGNEITGTWSFEWDIVAPSQVDSSIATLETITQFTGTR